jgi:hypothetical protein
MLACSGPLLTLHKSLSGRCSVKDWLFVAYCRGACEWTEPDGLNCYYLGLCVCKFIKRVLCVAMNVPYLSYALFNALE